MKFKRSAYITTWIAIVLILASATVATVIAFSYAEGNDLRIYLMEAAWIIVAVASFFLFLNASRDAIKRDMRKARNAGSENSEKETRKTGRVKPSDAEKLDIENIKRKCLRRVKPGSPPDSWGKHILDVFISELEIMSGVVYTRGEDGTYASTHTYALPHTGEPYSFSPGEGLTGQAVKSGQVTIHRNLTSAVRKVFSGLGATAPTYLAILPVMINDEAIAVFEVAGFKWDGPELDQLFSIITRNVAGELTKTEENDG